MPPNHLSDDELLSRLEANCSDGRRLLARLLVMLVEVEDRRLHLRVACSSLFDFCTRRLGMSEGQAFRRIAATRLVKRFPSLLGRIERGEIQLSSLVLLREHLTEKNVDELVSAASGKTKRQVQEMLARLAPKADVPSTIRKLPARAPQHPPAASSLPMPSPLPVSPPPAPPRLEPLSPNRHRLQLTITDEIRDKLERAIALMRHRNPRGEMLVVLDRALDGLLAELEKETRAATARPQRKVRPAMPTHVEREVRREVFERDGERCTFTDVHGARCPSRAFLEIDHIASRALGGSSDAANLRVYCRSHNQLHAEETFGRQHIARRIHVRQRKSERPDTC